MCTHTVHPDGTLCYVDFSIGILMELKGNNLITDVLDDFDDNYKILMEWLAMMLMYILTCM